MITKILFLTCIIFHYDTMICSLKIISLRIEMPEMSYVSQGKLHFLTRHVDAKEWQKPSKILMTTTIYVGNVILCYLFYES